MSLIEAGMYIETRIGQTKIFLNILIKNTFTSSPTKGNLDKFQLESKISPVISNYGGDKNET